MWESRATTTRSDRIRDNCEIYWKSAIIHLGRCDDGSFMLIVIIDEVIAVKDKVTLANRVF